MIPAGIHPGSVPKPLLTGRFYHLFEADSSTKKQLADADQEETVLDHGRAIRCAYCKTVITYRGNAEAIQGKHVHSFVNPSGYEFTIACYRRAWCRVMGLPMLEWSWFKAYSWQYALCPQCQEHLGWYYHCPSDDSSFYGLILDRLIIDPSGDGAE